MCDDAGVVLPGWRTRDWSLVAWIFGLITVALIGVPVWTYGDDAGWYSCGSLWTKADGLETGCEYSGSYRHRLWFVYGAAALTFASAAIAVRRRGGRPNRAGAVVSVAAVAATVVGVVAWRANDAVYVRPVYDFAATTLDVEPVARLAMPVADTEPTYRVAISATSWPSTSHAIFAACRSEVVPDSCDLMHASEGFVSADADGDIDALVDLRIPDGYDVIAGFDVEQFAGDHEGWPTNTSVVAPFDPVPTGDLPMVDQVDNPLPSPVATTSTAPTTVPDGNAAVVPEGYESTTARVTKADGTTCEICVWLATTSSERARGLMGVTDLGAADAMTFVYPEAHTGSFWMKDTVMPLSIAFYAPDGGYLDAFDMEPCVTAQCVSYPTPADFLIAVEVPQGALADLGMTSGSTLTLLDLPCNAR